MADIDSLPLTKKIRLQEWVDGTAKLSIRQAIPSDIVVGNIVFIEGDDEDLHEMTIDEVLRPSDEWKAFVASDGCRYGLDGCFIKEK